MLLAVEGDLDAAVLVRLLSELGLPSPNDVVGRSGKDFILARLDKYNAAAEVMPVVVVLDLDREECAPGFVQSLLSTPSLQMCLRVAVREIEAWLLADRAGIASHLHVASALVPPHPENEPDPKQVMADLARRSRLRWIREEVAPRPGSGRAVGPAYVDHLMSFVDSGWDITTAMDFAPSLRRAAEDLQRRL